GEQKLLAAVPEQLRDTLARAQQIVGFERMPADIFHLERPDPAGPAADDTREGAAVGVFLQAILDRATVALDYRSPYSGRTVHIVVTPRGLLWDRDRWYLAGRQAGRGEETRLWRADRVLAIAPHALIGAPGPAFDVGTLLGHRWLRAAMEGWREHAPVTIRLTRQQAERLRQDWYYRHAHFEDLPGDQVLMTFGEGDRAVVLDLLRWLGPGAELIAPVAWRSALRAELAQMLEMYVEEG
ncbi:MAG: helix-turn-helix transcriptional regulator, partial [Roseiflexaceae bacterium]